MRLLLFDLDGTLMRTGGAGLVAMRRAAAALFGDALSFDGVELAGGLDPHIFFEAARRGGFAATEDHHAEFRARYLAELERALLEARERIEVLPGVRALLDEVCARDGVVVGLLTGNYGEGARLKLKAGDLRWEGFRLTAFGDEADDRPGLVALALERMAALTGARHAPERALVIGDTPKDVACARAHGVPCLAVATGRFDVASLAAAGADHVAEDLSDPALVRRFLDAG